MSSWSASLPARLGPSRVERVAAELVAVSHAIHAHPEPCFEEHLAVATLVGALRAQGLEVTMMIHPEPANVEIAPYLANETLIVTMHGRAAHASSSARSGVDALDALVLGYQGAQLSTAAAAEACVG